MFEYLLRILNGQETAVFRLDQKVARDHNRVNRERKRLARKRSRAAKRERRREEELVTRSTHTFKSAKAQLSRLGAPSGLRRSRCDCGKSFASRKRRSRHFAISPLRKPQENPTLYGQGTRGRCPGLEDHESALAVTGRGSSAMASGSAGEVEIGRAHV